MKLYIFVVILFFTYSYGNIVSNVRVVNFADYVRDVISATVKRVEAKSWCNLKVADASFDIDEVVMRWHANGTLHYRHGFVHSIQAIDIRQDTVQTQVILNTEQQAQAIVRGTLRIHDVAIGYDVEAVLDEGTHRYTTSYVYPLINFVFTITKIIDGDDIDVTVIGNVPVSRNLPAFMPKNKATDVFTTLFDTNMAVDSINAWGPNVFKPIVEEIVTTQITYPRICYNCSA